MVEFKQGFGRSRAASRRQRRTVRARIHRLSVAMNRLRTHGPNPKNPDAVQRGILKAVRSAGLQPSRALFRKLRHNIHAQRGVKERFRKGIIRSGRYLQTMEAIFKSHGLPKELVRLPHVESSFNYASRSSKGAAGIWQFMPRTGRAYKLRVGRNVDERLDPIAATDGAARYLKDAYRKLGNWPLAITSYNHGQAGMARAKRRHGPNLLTVIDKYKSRSFRYASKNFYAEFLAAVEVSENYRTYFGPLELLEPHRYQEIYLDKSVRVSTFTTIAGLSRDVLREYNPQFKRRLWTRTRVLPAGFSLRIPAAKAEEARVALAKAPAVRWRGAPAKVPPDGYRIRRGDSLGVIARRFGTSVKAIQRLNDLEGTRIYAGQVLRIPGLRRASTGQGGSSGSRTAGGASAKSASPVPPSYRVRRGDSLSVIAQKFDTSVGAIKRMNGLRGSRIHPGQVLKLSESPPAPKQAAGPDPTASAEAKPQSEFDAGAGIPGHAISRQARRLADYHRPAFRDFGRRNTAGQPTEGVPHSGWSETEDTRPGNGKRKSAKGWRRIDFRRRQWPLPGATRRLSGLHCQEIRGLGPTAQDCQRHPRPPDPSGPDPDRSHERHHPEGRLTVARPYPDSLRSFSPTGAATS